MFKALYRPLGKRGKKTDITLKKALNIIVSNNLTKLLKEGKTSDYLKNLRTGI